MKGRKGTKVTQALYFTYSWGSPPYMDFRRYAGGNHLCKFWCGKIKGFGKYEGPNFWSFSLKWLVTLTTELALQHSL